MNRRDFLRRAAIVASGVVVADQLELLDRLGWTRRFFPSAEIPTVVASGKYYQRLSTGEWSITKENWDKLLREWNANGSFRESGLVIAGGRV